MKNKTKIEKVKIASVCQNILFHYYRHHKKSLTALRLWFIAKYLIDYDGRGNVQNVQLIKFSKLRPDYVYRYCKDFTLFRKVTTNKTYYRSLKSILKEHHLTKILQMRGEKRTQAFTRNLKDKKTFVGYIIKCYAERDLRKKKPRNITCGRISYQNIANYFGISRRTAITNIKNSTAKKFKNYCKFPDISFKHKSEFGNWLLTNYDKKIGKYIIGDNPYSYRVRWINNKLILTKDLPNIFKFTGTFLKNRSRGNSN